VRRAGERTIENFDAGRAGTPSQSRLTRFVLFAMHREVRASLALLRPVPLNEVCRATKSASGHSPEGTEQWCENLRHLRSMQPHRMTVRRRGTRATTRPEKNRSVRFARMQYLKQKSERELTLERNGDGVRTGLEDNIRTRKDRLALSNAELVQMACETCGKFGRRPATPTEARALLRLGA
jgi:beta-keto acid cleavage enzyme